MRRKNCCEFIRRYQQMPRSGCRIHRPDFPSRIFSSASRFEERNLFAVGSPGEASCQPAAQPRITVNCFNRQGLRSLSNRPIAAQPVQMKKPGRTLPRPSRSPAATAVTCARFSAPNSSSKKLGSVLEPSNESELPNSNPSVGAALSEPPASIAPAAKSSPAGFGSQRRRCAARLSSAMSGCVNL